MGIAVSLIRKDLGGSDHFFELLLGKPVAIADAVRVIEFSQGKGFPDVTEEGYKKRGRKSCGMALYFKLHSSLLMVCWL
jgi:hypothetical protein